MPIDISSFKCVHMWLKNKSYDGVTLNYVSIQACDHDSIQAYEYLSTWVHIPLISQCPQHSSTIV